MYCTPLVLFGELAKFRLLRRTMLQLYPHQAEEKLEFDKIKARIAAYCKMADAKELVHKIRMHSRIDYLKHALHQTAEYKMTLSSGEPFPNNFSHNIRNELNLLKVAGATLQAEDLDKIRKLCVNIHGIIIWFGKHPELFPHLEEIINGVVYEREINRAINQVIDEQAQIKDNASTELMNIRSELTQKRQIQRRIFERVLRSLNKEGYLADIGESFLNWRRTVAILAEYKRKVKGIIHGESDSGKTVFIEPDETVEINNEIGELERSEQREIQRILRQATAALKPFYEILSEYYQICVAYDFIEAKAKFAAELNAELPQITQHPYISLVNAYHPVLLLHNRENNKPTESLTVTLDRSKRILIISGPNAGGKTVSMKTIGLLQMMFQSGLLIPVDPRSELGIFKQLFVHIGDTQSIENELSTYSAHLRDMKYFVDFANGKTLFIIDELGSGSDPNLGGAFAEAIVEELVRKKAFGVITTHYLNLKVMAERITSIINGAMTFDEKHLQPLYKLEIGKPGSSYTFAIAKRSKLPPSIIERARELTEQGHFKLDKMLHKTEKLSVQLGRKQKSLDELIEKYERLVEEYKILTDKERIRQQQANIKLQNKIKKEELEYLRDMERKFKQIIHDWKKAEDKQPVIEAAEKILFRRRQIEQNQKMAAKADKKFIATGRRPEVGDLVRNTINHQVGTVVEMEEKIMKVKIGKLIFTTQPDNWITVRERSKPGKKYSEQ